ncbi:MAG: crossover junction endodeoxyribonuclease RuvC [Desulfovibrio sp.]|jgi:crossover junction endodeoxyribonuclease RuvC|nr:crossover junction endodeoxyribonuclease RuvC [Mailhella sp.]
MPVSLTAATITALGIDPGSNITGWGVVRERSGKLELLGCGALHVKGDTFSEKLASIYHGLHAVIEEYGPTEAGVEQVFSARNILSAIKLAQARGAAVAACASFDIPVLDYEPTQVKKTIVGVGRAEKEQVAFMVHRLLGGAPIGGPMDVTDAVAIALCHLTLRRFRRLEELQKGELKGGWKASR